MKLILGDFFRGVAESQVNEADRRRERNEWNYRTGVTNAMTLGTEAWRQRKIDARELEERATWAVKHNLANTQEELQHIISGSADDFAEFKRIYNENITFFGTLDMKPEEAQAKARLSMFGDAAPEESTLTEGYLTKVIDSILTLPTFANNMPAKVQKGFRARLAEQLGQSGYGPMPPEFMRSNVMEGAAAVMPQFASGKQLAAYIDQSERDRAVLPDIEYTPLVSILDEFDMLIKQADVQNIKDDLKLVKDSEYIDGYLLHKSAMTRINQVPRYTQESWNNLTVKQAKNLVKLANDLMQELPPLSTWQTPSLLMASVDKSMNNINPYYNEVIFDSAQGQLNTENKIGKEIVGTGYQEAIRQIFISHGSPDPDGTRATTAYNAALDAQTAASDELHALIVNKYLADNKISNMGTVTLKDIIKTGVSYDDIIALLKTTNYGNLLGTNAAIDAMSEENEETQAAYLKDILDGMDDTEGSLRDTILYSKGQILFNIKDKNSAILALALLNKIEEPKDAEDAEDADAAPALTPDKLFGNEFADLGLSLKGYDTLAGMAQYYIDGGTEVTLERVLKHYNKSSLTTDGTFNIDPIFRRRVLAERRAVTEVPIERVLPPSLETLTAKIIPALTNDVITMHKKVVDNVTQMQPFTEDDTVEIGQLLTRIEIPFGNALGVLDFNSVGQRGAYFGDLEYEGIYGQSSDRRRDMFTPVPGIRSYRDGPLLYSADDSGPIPFSDIWQRALYTKVQQVENPMAHARAANTETVVSNTPENVMLATHRLAEGLNRTFKIKDGSLVFNRSGTFGQMKVGIHSASTVEYKPDDTIQSALDEGGTSLSRNGEPYPYSSRNREIAQRQILNIFDVMSTLTKQTYYTIDDAGIINFDVDQMIQDGWFTAPTPDRNVGGLITTRQANGLMTRR